MQTLVKFVLATFIFSVVLTSCSKENETTAVSKTTLLIQQPWILKGYTGVRLSDGAVFDGYAPMSTCYKDDQYVYNADMTYEGNAGVNKCAESDPQVFSTGTWRFKSNETIVERIITSGVSVGTADFKVLVLSDSELKLSLEDGTYKHELTFSH